MAEIVRHLLKSVTNIILLLLLFIVIIVIIIIIIDRLVSYLLFRLQCSLVNLRRFLVNT